jgi:hypothetical protein
MSDVPERVGAIWSATTTLAFIKDELTGRMMLNQLWLDDLGLTEWRQVPMINRGDPVRRNPAVVGVAPPDEEAA